MSSKGEDEEQDDKKRRTRNQNEKKRRDQFNVLVDELMGLVGQGSKKKMDKALVLSTAVELLKKNKGFKHRVNIDKMNVARPPFMSAAEYCQLLLEATDGFVLVVEKGGDIGYVSETVTSVLGHDPLLMTGKSMYSFVHPDDHSEVKNHIQGFAMSHGDPHPDYLDFHCHMAHHSSDMNAQTLYEVCKVSGSLMSPATHVDSDLNEFFLFVVRSVNPILCKDIAFVDETNNEFTSRLSLEWKFLSLDHRASSIIGYFPFEVLGTSGYDYNHFDDLDGLIECHQKLMKYGVTTSDYYRFLTKGQQWVWLKTRHHISYNQWSSKPEFVVCTNSAVSDIHVAREKRRMMNTVKQATHEQPVAGNQVSSWAPGSPAVEFSETADRPCETAVNASQSIVGTANPDFDPTVDDIFSDVLEYSSSGSGQIDQEIMYNMVYFE